MLAHQSWWYYWYDLHIDCQEK